MIFIDTRGRILVNIHSINKIYEFDLGDFEGNHFSLSLFDLHRITLSRSEETGRIVVRLVQDD